MKFHLLNNIKTTIWEGIGLYWHLYKMKEAGLLQREKVEKLVKLIDLSYRGEKWTLECFKSHLEGYEKYLLSDDYECIHCKECSEFFNLDNY